MINASAHRNIQVVKNTLTISVFNALGLISGLGLDILLTARFGLGREMDALFLALTLPQLIFTYLSVSCNAVLVPAFSRALKERGKEGTWQLFSTIVTVALLIFVALAAAGALASPFIISLLAPGLDRASAVLAINLSRITFWFVLPAGVIQVMASMLNTHQRFAVPAALNLIQYSMVIVFALLGLPRWGIAAVAAGYVAAGFSHSLVLALAIWRIGGRYRPALHLSDPEIRKTARLFGPLVLKVSVGQSNILIERVLASFLPPGSISALGYARRILRAVSDIVLESVSTAVLPRFSGLAAQDDLTGLRAALAFALKLTIFVALPVVSLLVALNVPIIRLAFQRGAFDVSATRITASVMALYVLSVLPSGVLQVSDNVLFALRDTLTPLCVRIFTLVNNLVLDVALVRLLGLNGLALALSAANSVGAIVTLLVLSRRLGGLGSSLRSYFARVSLVGVAMGVASVVLRCWWEKQELLSLGEQLLAAVFTTGLGMLLYLIMNTIMGVVQIDQALALIKRQSVHSRKP